MDSMSSIFDKFADVLKTVLPTSPFRQFLDSFASIDYLGYLNWFVPVGDILKVMIAWLGAVTAFYIYSIVLRWIKAING